MNCTVVILNIFRISLIDGLSPSTTVTTTTTGYCFYHYNCLCVFLAVIQRLFFFRSDEMVEALSTSFQNLFNKYTKSENVENVPQNGKREIYIVPVNKQPDDQQLRFQRPKSRRTFLFDTKILCQSKESKWPIIRQKKLRPLVGQCCSVCIPV